MDPLSPANNLPTSAGLSYHGLPVELIEKITALLPIPSIASMSRVSRLLYEISVPLLYRDIDLQSSAALVSCYRSLAKHPEARQKAQSLAISFNASTVKDGIWQPKPWLSSFHQLLMSGTRSLTNLTSLTLHIISMSQLGLDTLSVCKFPFLTTFSTALRLCPVQVAFLNRHPTLITLVFAGDQTPREHQKLVLPNLELLNCSAGQICFQKMENGPVQKLGLRWKYRGPPRAPTPSLVRLYIANFINLTSLTCFRPGSNIELLEAFTTLKLPHLRLFDVQCYFKRRTDIEAKVAQELAGLRGIKSFHKTCPCLKFFYYTYHNMDHTMLSLRTLSEDRKIAVAWGARHPSLQTCLLTSGRKLSRISPNEKWFVRQD